MVERRLILPRVTTVCKRSLHVSHFVGEDMTLVNTMDPSIMAPMKHAKMIPNGRMPAWCANLCDDFSAGLQKKMNKYMEPSKQQDVRPNVSTCLSTTETSAEAIHPPGNLDLPSRSSFQDFPGALLIPSPLSPKFSD